MKFKELSINILPCTVNIINIINMLRKKKEDMKTKFEREFFRFEAQKVAANMINFAFRYSIPYLSIKLLSVPVAYTTNE